MNEINAEELQEILRRVLHGVESGKISPMNASRINDAALLVMRMSSQTYKRDISFATAVLRQAYEDLAIRPSGSNAQSP